jgi:hypothetical protein
VRQGATVIVLPPAQNAWAGPYGRRG